jgi:hypothetical protein
MRVKGMHIPFTLINSALFPSKTEEPECEKGLAFYARPFCLME